MDTKRTGGGYYIEQQWSGFSALRMEDGTLIFGLAANHALTAEETEAHRSRIIAALNACSGLSTEALEAGVVGEMREALRDFRNGALDVAEANDIAIPGELVADVDAVLSKLEDRTDG